MPFKYDPEKTRDISFNAGSYKSHGCEYCAIGALALGCDQLVNKGSSMGVMTDVSDEFKQQFQERFGCTPSSWGMTYFDNELTSPSFMERFQKDAREIFDRLVQMAKENGLIE